MDGKRGKEKFTPQFYIDFQGWENRICMTKLLLNHIQASKNNK